MLEQARQIQNGHQADLLGCRRGRDGEFCGQTQGGSEEEQPAENWAKKVYFPAEHKNMIFPLHFFSETFVKTDLNTDDEDEYYYYYYDDDNKLSDEYYGDNTDGEDYYYYYDDDDENDENEYYYVRL